jgi:erythromycin esterase-like protein
VAIESDWPAAHRVSRYVQGAGADADAEEALRGFQRFLTWMWRNTDVVDFTGWLRAFNDRRRAGAPAVRVYGLDLYSLHASMAAVVGVPRAGGSARRGARGGATPACSRTPATRPATGRRCCCA